MSISNQQILELADKISSICEIEDKHANLLNEVTINENSHSRFLRLLLGYNVDGKYPFYSSFRAIDKIATTIPLDLGSGKPCFVNEWARIDLLIKATDYAIIIENKIYDAPDQDTQLERYINFCLNCGYRENQIYVLYLTKDGTKKVSDSSLTKRAKELLGVEKDSHLIEINFKHDILPWIQTSLIPYAKNSDEIMYSALIQYSDYLNSMFEDDNTYHRNNDKIMNTLKEYGINSFSELNDTIDAVEILKQALDSKRESIINERVQLHIFQPLSEYCKSHGVDLDFRYHTSTQMEIRISVPGLLLSSYCFSHESVGICSIAGNGVDQIAENSVIENLQYNGYTVRLDKSWWLAEKRSPIRDDIGTIIYWDELVPKGDVYKRIIEKYEEIVSILHVKN